MRLSGTDAKWGAHTAERLMGLLARDWGFASERGNLVSYYRQYLRLMDHWRQVLPVSIIPIKYEAIVEDLEGVSRQLVDACGLLAKAEQEGREHAVRTFTRIAEIKMETLAERYVDIYARAIESYDSHRG